MSYMTDLLGHTDAKELEARHDGTHDVSDAECEDWITTKDFWADGVMKDLGEMLAHLMVVVEPVGIAKGHPTIQEICDRYNDLVQLKRKAMEKARAVL